MLPLTTGNNGAHYKHIQLTALSGVSAGTRHIASFCHFSAATNSVPRLGVRTPICVKKLI